MNKYVCPKGLCSLQIMVLVSDQYLLLSAFLFAFIKSSS